MKKLAQTLSELQKAVQQLEKKAYGPNFSNPSYEDLLAEWKDSSVDGRVEEFVKASFKAIKLYEELMAPMHGHPELKEPHSQMKRIYECLIEAKKSTESAISEWRRFQSTL